MVLLPPSTELLEVLVDLYGRVSEDGLAALTSRFHRLSRRAPGAGSSGLVLRCRRRLQSGDVDRPTQPNFSTQTSSVILPVNGLCVRPANMLQVVMNAEQAAALTAVLNPTVALPHHYAFRSGQLSDRIFTEGDHDPRHYTDALARVAPQVASRIVLPGTPVTVS